MPGRPAASNLRWRFDVEGADISGVLVLVLRGRLTAAASALLIQTVAEAIDGGRRRVIVDCAAVDYVSGAGVIALDALHGRLAVAGGELVICGIDHPAVKHVFELSGLLPHFVVEPNQTAALLRWQP